MGNEFDEFTAKLLYKFFPENMRLSIVIESYPSLRIFLIYMVFVEHFASLYFFIAVKRFAT